MNLSTEELGKMPFFFVKTWSRILRRQPFLLYCMVKPDIQR